MIRYVSIKKYNRRIDLYGKLDVRVKKGADLMVYIRGITGLFFLAGIFFVTDKNFFLIPGIILAGIFIWAVYWHGVLKKTINKLDKLLEINQEAILRLEDKWNHFLLTGEEFIDFSKPHLSELNIFGKNSIFQMIQQTATKMGINQLASWLSSSSEFSVIPERQEAVKELSSRISFRQHLMMEGRLIGKYINPEKFLEWVLTQNILIKKKWAINLFRGLLSTTFLLFFLNYFWGVKPYWIAGIVIQSLIFIFTERKVRSLYLPVLNRDSLFLTYRSLFSLMEKQKFKTDYLNKLQKKLFVGSKTPSGQMKRLEKINSALCLRYNALMYPILNILLLWDLHFLYKLELWKEEMAPHLKEWFEALGEAEALNSFAGAPVAAKALNLRPCKIITSINIADSLTDHVSHFYAEVKRIKDVLDEVKIFEGEKKSLPVLFLVDEIFSGTNTKERLIASEKIILKLAGSKSYGLITTHDLDLAKLEEDSPKIKNYHFQDKVDEKGEMFFDYKLKEGPVSSTNALAILKMAGVEL